MIVLLIAKFPGVIQSLAQRDGYIARQLLAAHFSEVA